jgi:malonyl CoA-acyl carrier protein transacylase/aryl carrier-like protein
MDLRALLFAAEDDEAAGERLGQTRFTQPALFVVEYALARQWMEWGSVPQAMLGHSIGEYVAACIAGVLSLEGALALVAERGRLMQSLPAGAMLAVPLPEVEVVPLLTAELSLAAVNAPDRCVISGPHDAVAALRARLEARGVAARPLHTSHAFHSAMMEPILVPFTQRFEGIELRPPRIPYVSNLTGTWITEAEATDTAYWARHLRQAVRFADGVRELCRDPNLILLEVGPGQTLASFARQHPDRGRDRVVLTSLRHPKDRQEDLPGLLKTLGQLWLAGGNPDWQGFYARERRRRIPLPTYPFERRHFWIDPGDAVGGLFGMEVSDPKKEDIADWFYLPYWKPSLPPSPEPEEGSRWLVFLDTAGLAERIVARLAGEDRTVVTVAAGEAFCKTGDGHFELAPGRHEDYDALIKELASSGKLPDRILHLWNVGTIASGSESLTTAPDLSFWSLLFLAQSLGRSNVTQPIRMAVVSSHMQRVAGEDHILPERALLLGPSKIIPQEYPNLRCVSIDIDLPAGEAMVGRLIAEAEAEPSGNVVAYRQGRRWVQSYEAVRLEETAGRSIHLRERGVYLITGGLGGLGLTFAEFLAREYRARLVLVGASSLPDRADWQDWLRSHGEADRISERIRKVREIESLGAEVMVVSADVADRERMRALVGEALARFGEIHGLIHAAGIAGGGMIQLKTAEMAGRVLSPKVAGTRALLDALAGVPLDFVVLCSSTTAVAGGLGQVDYCAANNFLDAFASAMALAGGPRTVSINWGAWEEVGMAVAAGLLPARPRQRESGASEQIHPLLDRWIAGTADQSIYETGLSPARHWVLSEHKIMGTPTVPGTTHLELARAAFQHHTATVEGRSLEGGVEIRDVLFLTPLLLPEGERNVRVFLTKEADSFAFRVASRIDPVTVDGEPIWQTHAQGRIAALAQPAVREHYDLEEIRARCNAQVVEITGPVNRGDRLVYWGPHWQSLKRIHLASSEALALIELPEEFAGETERYGLHPALLDATTSIGSLFGKEDYLPISYRKLKVYRPLPRCFFGYLRRHGEAGSTGETIAVDVTILTETGEALVEIEHFTLKRVGDAAITFQRATEAVDTLGTGDGHPETTFLTPAAQAEETVDAERSNGIRPEEGVEALRRVLSRDFDLPQIVVVARDLHALIARVGAINRASIAEAAGAGALQAAVHARPNIPTPYVAPSTEHERRLAAVWQATLGIEQVGVNDNFFDLGGDSILGIHIVARAGEAGLRLSPDQLFEHQTIAELAKLFESAPQEEMAAARPLPVTSFQRELLENGVATPCWYAVWPLLPEVAAGAEREVLLRALEQVVARHEALRTRFTQGPEGWTQTPAASSATPEVREVDLSVTSWTDREAGVMALAEELRQRLDPERGMLVVAAILSESQESPKRALLVAHPLVVDGTSWILLREELRSACQQLAAEGDVGLPPATAPFHRWLSARAERDPAQGLRPEAGDWLKSWEAAAALPSIDPVSWGAGVPATGTVSVRLSAGETRALLEDIPDLQRVRVEEVVLAALARTFVRKSGGRSALIQAEVDAREADPLDLDLSHTVGCFTVALPVLLDLGSSGDPGEELRLVKEQFRDALVNGARCSLFGDLSGDAEIRLRLAALPVPEVSFSYFGDAQVAAARTTGAALAVTGQLDGEGLRFDWRAREDERFGAAVPAMAAAFLESLRSLVDFCLSATVALYTPSDFPDADLSQEELDKLFT